MQFTLQHGNGSLLLTPIPCEFNIQHGNSPFPQGFRMHLRLFVPAAQDYVWTNILWPFSSCKCIKGPSVKTKVRDPRQSKHICLDDLVKGSMCNSCDTMWWRSLSTSSRLFWFFFASFAQPWLIFVWPAFKIPLNEVAMKGWLSKEFVASIKSDILASIAGCK